MPFVSQIHRLVDLDMNTTNCPSADILGTVEGPFPLIVIFLMLPDSISYRNISCCPLTSHETRLVALDRNTIYLPLSDIVGTADQLSAPIVILVKVFATLSRTNISA